MHQAPHSSFPFNSTGNGVRDIQFLVDTLNVGDPIDVLAYWPGGSSGGGNLIPVASQNFSTGWITYQGASVAVTQGQTPIIVDSMDYQPSGELITGRTRTTHMFTGDEHDSESNLEHTWFRQYSSAQGRWITPDPYLGSASVADAQSWNRYSYVENNATNAIDPLGLYCPAYRAEGVFCLAGNLSNGFQPDAWDNVPGVGGFSFGVNFGGIPSPGSVNCFAPGSCPTIPFGSLGQQIQGVLASLPTNNTGTGQCGDFAPCPRNPAGNGFSAGSIALGGICLVVEPCGAAVGAVGLFGGLLSLVALLGPGEGQNDWEICTRAPGINYPEVDPKWHICAYSCPSGQPMSFPYPQGAPRPPIQKRRKPGTWPDYLLDKLFQHDNECGRNLQGSSVNVCSDGSEGQM